MDILAQKLVRNYYLCEAMAFYEAYYSPTIERLAGSVPDKVKESMQQPGRSEDHPLTWVPIVFHCTNFESFQQIIKDGMINAPVSLTEIPIGELDRMKGRTFDAHQIAIGFPRRYVQSRKAASVLHTKHHPELNELLKSQPALKAQLDPFVVVDDDVSAFQELRAAEPLEISQAIWVLTTDRSEDQQPIISARDEYISKWGHIAMSFWHRSHQMGMLGEWQYLHVVERDGKLVDFDVIGEHYWKQRSFVAEEQVVRLPAGKDRKLRFPARTPESEAYVGPYTFYDLAKKTKALLKRHLNLQPELPYALFANA